MNQSGGWTDEWPPENSSSNSNTPVSAGKSIDPRSKDNEIPKAIEISFDLERFGKVKRLYDLPVYLENKDIVVTPPNGGG